MSDTCCDEFEAAENRGDVVVNWDRWFFVKLNYAPNLRFCPWCGASVNTHPASAETEKGKER